MARPRGGLPFHRPSHQSFYPRHSLFQDSLYSSRFFLFFGLDKRRPYKGSFSTTEAHIVTRTSSNYQRKLTERDHLSLFMLIAGPSSCNLVAIHKTPEAADEMALHTLPYDLLLNIAEHLDLYDVLSLHLVSGYVDMAGWRDLTGALITDSSSNSPARPCKISPSPAQYIANSLTISCSDVERFHSTDSNASRTFRPTS